MAIHGQVLGAPGKDNALYIQIGRGQRVHRLLCDCGEVGLADLPLVDLRSIDHLLFSHLHMDHIGGFDTFFRQNFNRPWGPVRVWGPPETARIVQHRLQGFMWNLHADLVGEWLVCDIGPDALRTTRFLAREGFAIAHPAGEAPRGGPVIATDDFVVEALALDHQTPSLGYVVREAPRRTLDPARLAGWGLAPGPWIGQLKTPRPGEGPTLEVDGRSYDLAALRADLLSEAPGASLAYLTDFRLDGAEIRRLAPALAGVATLVCESQYREADGELAARAFHLTARQAGELALAAGARDLLLIHISERYGREDLPAILAEARAVFPGARFPDGWGAGSQGSRQEAP